MFVRWDNLTLDAEQGTRLPGYRDPAVVRRFDAPEALETRFYEVRAKSVLNKVPDASKMPFRWTINPYRGCSHACVYCLGGETPILMADGSHKPLSDLREGDRIYGTVQDGRYRRLVRTEVQAHWSTVKPAFRVTLEDGTALVASGDHRFLTQKGWKHVKGAGQRPHLTGTSVLVGTGAFAEAPAFGADFRQGWLRGVQARAAAIADAAVRKRLQAYLAIEGRINAAVAVGGGGQLTLGDDPATSVRWPLSPSDEWRRGLLSGLFDVDGSTRGGVLRVAVGDDVALRWAAASLSHFGFDALVEEGRGDEPRSIRLRGGLRERLRFGHLTAPASLRRHALEGAALPGGGRLKVASIEPLGTMRLYDITTGTGDFIADGVVSHNCFARPTHTFLDFDAGRDFEKEIVVKVNAPEVLRVELARPKWKGEHVAMGTNTDPYQWVEGKYKLMPGIWAALRDARNPCSVLTKSPLVLRDLPLLREINAVASVSANLSVPTIDPKMWRATEPHTPHPKARLEAVAELNRNGIPTGILAAPLMPGINDDPKQVETILQAASDAGATGVGGIALHLRGEVRGVFMDWLRSERPDLVPRYERLYARGAYAPEPERRRLAGLLRRPGLDRFSRDPVWDRPDHAGLRSPDAPRDPRHGADPADAPGPHHPSGAAGSSDATRSAVAAHTPDAARSPVAARSADAAGSPVAVGSSDAASTADAARSSDAARSPGAARSPDPAAFDLGLRDPASRDGFSDAARTAAPERFTGAVERDAGREETARVAAWFHRENAGLGREQPLASSRSTADDFYVRGEDKEGGLRKACHGWRGEVPEDPQTSLF